LGLRVVSARLAEETEGDTDRPHYVRGRLENGEFIPVGRQESHAIFGLSNSNALLRVSPGAHLAPGAVVRVELWD
ncbi:MAG: hypothetical protein JWO45_1688, partial [Spartobacteria bacterium]|nr:hypothetical protein [Spartobacteria bacterium]